MSMRIVVKEAQAFKSVIDCIVSLIEEGHFEVTHQGLSLRAMDPSQISMVSLNMPKSAFIEYNVTDETKLGLNIVQLSSVLSRGKKNEKVEMYTEEGRFVIHFIGEKHKRVFKIPLLDSGERLQNEPKLDLKNSVTMRADTIKDVLKDARLVSSHINMQITAEHFLIFVSGESGEIKSEFEKGAELTEIKYTNGAKATYPLQYLEDMVKASSSSAIIKLNMETDKPIKVEYEVEGAHISYFLAPRIESD